MAADRTLSRWSVPVLLVLLYGLVLGILATALRNVPRPEIPDLLVQWTPWNLRVNLILLLAGVLWCGRDLARGLKPLCGRKGALLAALLAAAFLLVFLAAPRTGRIFYDEQIYTNIGQNIAVADRAGFSNYATFENGEYAPRWIEYAKQPHGWPFLISLAFQVFGVAETPAYVLNNLLYCGSVLLVFFTAWRLTGRFFAGFSAALVLALIPHNILWSNTRTVEPSTAFVTCLAVFLTLLYTQTQRPRHLFLRAATRPLACQMRTESVLVGVWVLAALLAASPRALRRREFWAAGLSPAFFLIPHLLHLHAFRDHPWGAQGPRFSAAYLPDNLSMNGLYFLSNRDFPVLFTLLFLAGLFARRCPARWRALILFWFLLFWGIFLFYYAGGYRYGADVRYALVAFPPFAVLAGLGADAIRERAAALIARAHGRRQSGGAAPTGEDAGGLPRAGTFAKPTGHSHFSGPSRSGIKSFRALLGSRLRGNDESAQWRPVVPGKEGVDLLGGPFPRRRISIFSESCCFRHSRGSANPVFLGPSGSPPSRERQAPPIPAPGRGPAAVAAAAITALILASFLWHLPRVREVGREAWASRCDEAFARRFMEELPPGSIVLTHTPSMFLVHGHSAIQAYAGVHHRELIHAFMDRFEGGVYFHSGYWCNTQDREQNQVCRGIRDRYILEPVDRAREQGYEYVLYRLSRRE